MSGEFQHGLFGCFGNCRVCICTWFCPCYVAGKVAEKVGEPCFLNGCLTFVPIANIICGAKIREKVREQKGIAGSYCPHDVLMRWFCAGCALCQEAQEVNALDDAAVAAEGQSMERE